MKRPFWLLPVLVLFFSACAPMPVAPAPTALPTQATNVQAANTPTPAPKASETPQPISGSKKVDPTASNTPLATPVVGATQQANNAGFLAKLQPPNGVLCQTEEGVQLTGELITSLVGTASAIPDQLEYQGATGTDPQHPQCEIVWRVPKNHFNDQHVVDLWLGRIVSEAENQGFTAIITVYAYDPEFPNRIPVVSSFMLLQSNGLKFFGIGLTLTPYSNTATRP